MSDSDGQTIYRQLVERHGVRIPMLQRDYAQGRQGQEEVRERFLDALQEALELPPDDPSLPRNLDFIYGSVEKRRDGTYFFPLDGQQRLTTLFLLHWYLAWRDDCAADFELLFHRDGHARFSYSVRTTSSEFFDKLVTRRPEKKPDEIVSLRDWITNQSWYFRYWRFDPTIVSALTMLQALHERLAQKCGLYARLTDEVRPAITFQLLDLKDFGLSDDLYIKMNARGKPLTSFEAFKARYEQELIKLFVGQKRSIEANEFSVADFVARRMDTRWADLFWAHRVKGTHLYDEQIMNLFRVLALVSRDPKKNSFLQDLDLLRDKSKAPIYSTYHKQRWLDEDFTSLLIAVLEQWSRGGGELQLLLPNAEYFDETDIFGRLIRDPLDLSQTEVIQFTGYALFIKEHEPAIDSAVFQEWMRVVRNLAVNTLIERPDDFHNAAKAIRELLPNADEILAYLTALTEKDQIAGFSRQQVAEEQVKAGLIRSHPGWRPLIDRAEQHSYFLGQIEFLLEFSGALEEWSKTRQCAWEERTHRRLQQSFERYLTSAEMMFEKRGLKAVPLSRWERALLTLGDYLLNMGWTNLSFLVDAATDASSWKRLLRGGTPSDARKRELLKQLWGNLTTGRPVAEQLDDIISATGLPPWREELVRTPDAVAYCWNRAIRKENDLQIYLLSRKQMNGQHAELFTFCLYDRLRQPKRMEQLQPFMLTEYSFRTDRYEEPHFPLRFRYDAKILAFLVYFTDAKFHTWIDLATLQPFPELRTLLQKSAGFVESDGWLEKISSREEVEPAIAALAVLLATHAPATAAL